MPDPTLSDLFQAIAAKARAAQQQAGPALQQFGGAVRQEAGDAAAGWLRSGADTFDHVGNVMTGGHPAQSAQNIYGTSSTPTLADRMRAWAPQAQAWGQQGQQAPQGTMQRVMAAAGHAVGGAAMETAAAAPGMLGVEPGRTLPRIPTPGLTTENVAANPFAHLPEPPRVYHGTSATFHEFSPALRDIAGEDSDGFGPGYYFTDHPGVAGGTDRVTGYARLESPTGEHAPQVRPARVALTRPFDTGAPIDMATAEAMVRHAVTHDGATAPHDVDEGVRAITDLLPAKPLGRHVFRAMRAYYGDNQGANDALRSLGFDGITHDEVDAPIANRFHVAFDPAQVRSPWGDWKDAPQFGALALTAGGAAAAARKALGLPDPTVTRPPT